MILIMEGKELENFRFALLIAAIHFVLEKTILLGVADMIGIMGQIGLAKDAKQEGATTIHASVVEQQEKKSVKNLMFII